MTVLNPANPVTGGWQGPNLWTDVASDRQLSVLFRRDGGLSVGRRQRSGSAWDTFQIAGAAATALGLPNVDGDTHCFPSIIVDGLGFIHLWANMHGDPLRYIKSTTSIRTNATAHHAWTGAQTLPNPDTEYSYPLPVRLLDGSILLFLRSGPGGGSGSSRGDTHFWKLAANGSVWSAKTKIFRGINIPGAGPLRATPTAVGTVGSDHTVDDGSNGSFYPSMPYCDSLGRIHIAGVWRTTVPPVGSSGARENFYPTHIYSDNGGTTWKAADGTVMVLPIDFVNFANPTNLACRLRDQQGNLIQHPQSYGPGEHVYPNTDYVNDCGLTTDDLNNPRMTMSAQPWFQMWYEGTLGQPGGFWHQDYVRDTGTGGALNGYAVGGTQNCYWLDGALWVLFTSPTGFVHYRLARLDASGNSPTSVAMSPELDNNPLPGQTSNFAGGWRPHADPEAFRALNSVEVSVPDVDSPRVYTFSGTAGTAFGSGGGSGDAFGTNNDYVIPTAVANGGLTDVTVAVQAILDDPTKFTTGTRLRFPAGVTFRCDKSLVINDHNYFLIDGQGATIKATVDKPFPAGVVGDANWNANRGRCNLLIQRGQHQRVQNLIINGSDLGGGRNGTSAPQDLEAQHGIDAIGVDDFRARNCTIWYTWGAGINLSYTAKTGASRLATNCQITGCDIQHNGYSGIDLIGCTDVLIAHNNLNDLRRTGIDIEPVGSSTDCQRITIRENDIHNYGPGFYWLAMSAYAGSPMVGDITTVGNRTSFSPIFCRPVTSPRWGPFTHINNTVNGTDYNTPTGYAIVIGVDVFAQVATPVALPTGTITMQSIPAGFPAAGVVYVHALDTYVSYASRSGTQFLGCSGGSGALTAGMQIRPIDGVGVDGYLATGNQLNLSHFPDQTSTAMKGWHVLYSRDVEIHDNNYVGGTAEAVIEPYGVGAALGTGGGTGGASGAAEAPSSGKGTGLGGGAGAASGNTVVLGSASGGGGGSGLAVGASVAVGVIPDVFDQEVGKVHQRPPGWDEAGWDDRPWGGMN